MNGTPENFALIAYIARSIQPGHKLGKKALQKLVHLVSEIADVPVGYKFRLYTYGPFSRELATDVDILDSLDALTVSFSAERNGYEISADAHAEDFINKAEGYIEAYREGIDKILKEFGPRLAKELELSSMLTFIIKENLVDNIGDDAKVVGKFLEIKPHYSKSQVEEGLVEIRQLLH